MDMVLALNYSLHTSGLVLVVQEFNILSMTANSLHCGAIMDC